MAAARFGVASCLVSVNAGAQFLEYMDAMITPGDVAITGFAPHYAATFISAPGDVNGDGYDDLLVHCFIAPTGRLPVGVYLGSASPQPEMFANSTTPGIGPAGEIDLMPADDSSLSSVTPHIGDLNGDGRDDILLGWLNEFRIVFGRSVWPAGGIRTHQGEADVYIRDEESNIAHTLVASMRQGPADYNGDGKDDLNQWTQGQSAPFNDRTARENVFLGREFWPSIIEIPATLGDVSAVGTERQYVPMSVAAVDINRDGYDEMLSAQWWVTRPDIGYFSIVWGAPNLPANIEYDSESMPGVFNEPIRTERIALADFNGDGDIDIAIKEGYTVRLHFDLTEWTPGSSAYTTADVHITLPYLGVRPHTGDFNGDGIDDLMLVDPNTRAGLSESIHDPSIHILYGRPAWPLAIDLATQFANVTIAGITDLDYDFDGDLLPDLIADINGDGMDDIFLYREADFDDLSLNIILGGNDLPSIIRYNVDGPDFRIVNMRLGKAGDRGIVRLDFNGDGNVDIAYLDDSPLTNNTALEDPRAHVLFGRTAPEHIYVNRTTTIPGDGTIAKPYRQLRLGLKTVKVGGTLHLLDGGATTTISFPQRISKQVRITR